eukprot:1195925-Prorocentrum_minimum.AAC.3
MSRLCRPAREEEGGGDVRCQKACSADGGGKAAIPVLGFPGSVLGNPGSVLGYPGSALPSDGDAAQMNKHAVNCGEVGTGERFPGCRREASSSESYWRGWFVALRAHTLRRENIPALPVSDWSIARIYPHFLCLIGEGRRGEGAHQARASGGRHLHVPPRLLAGPGGAVSATTPDPPPTRSGALGMGR